MPPQAMPAIPIQKNVSGRCRQFAIPSGNGVVYPCRAREAVKLIPALEAVKLIPMARRSPRWCGVRHFHKAEYLPLLSIQ